MAQEDNIYFGKMEYLLDFTKTIENHSLFFNPNFIDLQEILSIDFENRTKIIIISENEAIKILNFSIDDIDLKYFILIDSASISINLSSISKKIKILDEKMINNIVREFLNLKQCPLIKTDVFNTLYIYEITGEIRNSKNFEEIDTIGFFKKIQFEGYSFKSSNKINPFISIAYYLEYSFLTTGLKGLPIYFLLLKKILKSKSS